MRNVFLLAHFLLCTTTWTTLAPLPAGGYPSTCAGAGSGFKMVTVCLTKTHMLDVPTGAWTTLPSQPSSRYNQFVGASAAGSIFSVAGSSPKGNRVEALTLTTGVWTTKATAPNVRTNAFGGSDGATLFVAGDSPLTAVSQALDVYDILLDQWTVRRSLPVMLLSAGCAVTANSVIVIDAASPLNTFTYTIATDAWTTGTSVPSGHGNLFDQAAGQAGYVFVVGGNISPSRALERYEVLADTWVVLEPLPLACYAGSGGITASGHFVVAGCQTNREDVHVYATGLLSEASVTGDPVLTGFNGVSRHLQLYTGVFAFLTTPTLVVNGLVEHVASLPPEEDTVVTMLGIVALVNGCLVKTSTSVVGNVSDPTTTIRVFSCDMNEVTDSVVPTPTSLTLATAGMTVKIECHLTHHAASLSSAYINFFARPTGSPTAPPTCGGLLGSLTMESTRSQLQVSVILA